MYNQSQGLLHRIIIAVICFGGITFAYPELPAFFWNNIRYSVTGQSAVNRASKQGVTRLFERNNEIINQYLQGDGNTAQSDMGVPHYIADISTKGKPYNECLLDMLANQGESDVFKKINKAFKIAANALEETSNYLE